MALCCLPNSGKWARDRLDWRDAVDRPKQRSRNEANGRKLADEGHECAREIMFNDYDTWPVTCCECGFVHEAEIRALKVTENIHCPRCGSDLTFSTEGFQNQLRTVREISGLAVREAHKPNWDHLRQKPIPPDAAFAQMSVASAQRNLRQAALTSVLTSKRPKGHWA
jgi:hypothetical protein